MHYQQISSKIIYYFLFKSPIAPDGIGSNDDLLGKGVYSFIAIFQSYNGCDNVFLTVKATYTSPLFWIPCAKGQMGFNQHSKKYE
jgi:hypothetical protein